jgi:hypothetical protein
VANGNVGMHYILPSRDLIAHDVEIIVKAHRLDAVVLLGSCDKIVPGMLMAAARLDVPQPVQRDAHNLISKSSPTMATYCLIRKSTLTIAVASFENLPQETASRIAVKAFSRRR